MLIEQVLHAAAPTLQGRQITKAVLGLSLIGLELDGHHIGLSYMLREDLPAGCGAFAFAQSLIGADAFAVAELARTGANDAQRGVGIAAITAACCTQDLPEEDPAHPAFGVAIQPEDTVGMIGHIPPVAARIREMAETLILFDEGIARQAQPGPVQVEPTARQAELLPQCDVVIMTGTVMINGTVDALLKMCPRARDIVLVGSSTPMIPEAFKGSGVTVLAGSCWESDGAEDLFNRLSLGGGISHVMPWMKKKAVRVP